MNWGRERFFADAVIFWGKGVLERLLEPRSANQVVDDR